MKKFYLLLIIPLLLLGCQKEEVIITEDEANSPNLETVSLEEAQKLLQKTSFSGGGLYNSNATNTIFNSLVPNQVDRDRIKARISAEADNTTINEVSPAGKKAC